VTHHTVKMAAFAAREKSGLATTLSFKSLILIRFVSVFVAFFILSVSYSRQLVHAILDDILAFVQPPQYGLPAQIYAQVGSPSHASWIILTSSARFGDAGFVIFWMLNYANMLAV